MRQLTGIGGRRRTDGDRAERLAGRRRRFALGQHRAGTGSGAAAAAIGLQVLDLYRVYGRGRRGREAAVDAARHERAARVAVAAAAAVTTAAAGRHHDRGRRVHVARRGRPVLVLVALHRQPVLGQELVQVAVLPTNAHKVISIAVHPSPAVTTDGRRPRVIYR